MRYARFVSAVLIGMFVAATLLHAEDACVDLSNGVKCQGDDYIYVGYYDGGGFYFSGGCSMEWNSNGSGWNNGGCE